MEPLVLEMAQDFARRARARLGERIREVRVFGSRARGDAGPASDLDLFILVDRDDRATRLELYGIANDVMLDHDCHLAPSPLVMGEVELAEQRARERRLVRDIYLEGVLV